MIELKDEEMRDYNGGNKLLLGGIVVTIAAFLFGILDGINNPQSCHK